MDVVLIVQTVLIVIGVLTVALRIIAPLTKWSGDDKVLVFLEKVLKSVVVPKSKDKIEIKIK